MNHTIPDLSIEAKTPLDFPFHCVSATPKKIKGDAGIKWDIVVESSADKDDAGATGLPVRLADLRTRMLSALELDGEPFTLVSRPKIAVALTLHSVSGGTQSMVLHRRAAVVRQVTLAVTPKGFRVRFSMRVDGDGTEQLGAIVGSSVLCESVPSQQRLPLRAVKVLEVEEPAVAEADPLPAEPGEQGVPVAPPGKPGGRRPRAS